MTTRRPLRVLGAVLVLVASACGAQPVPSAPLSGAFHVQQRCPPGMFINPSYDPRWVVEGNMVSFRLRGESIWRPGCVSAPDIVEENATSFRRRGSAIWERK